MKKNKLLKVFLPMGLAAGAIAITTPFIVSCSDSNEYTPQSKFVNVITQTFDTSVSKTRTNNFESKVSSTNVYEPQHNQNAIDKLNNLLSNITVTSLQTDFNRVLTDFYESYENEHAPSEVEIDHIEVLSKASNNLFRLRVHYEVSIDNDDYAARDLEFNKTVDIDWSPKLVFLTDKDEREIKQQLNQSQGVSGLELDDIKEIFFGERDDDMDADDYGIFDRLRMINKQNNNNAAMVAYEISIADIYDKIPQQRSKQQIIDKNTKFRIPSIALNGGSVVFVPNKKPNITNNPKTFTQAELDRMFSQNKVVSIESEIQNELNTLFGQNVIDARALKIVQINYYQKSTDKNGANVYKVKVIYSNTFPVSDPDHTVFTADDFFLSVTQQQPA